MTALADPALSTVRADPDAADPDAAVPSPACPHLHQVLMRVVMSVVIAVLVPALLFWATLTIFDFPAAVVVALGWMVAAMGWRRVTRRPVSGLLLLTLALLTIRTVLTLATGSTFLYFIQPVFADGAVAVLFLGSLWTARPVVARIAPDFYPMDAAVHALPGMRLLFRRLTLMWALVILVKAGITVALLESVSTVDFVLIKAGAITTLTLTAAVVTVVWSVIVGRQEGLLRAR